MASDIAPDRLIAVVAKNATERARFEISLTTLSSGKRRAVLRVREKNGQGEFRADARSIAIPPDKLRPIIDALELAEKAAVDEGLLQK